MTDALLSIHGLTVEYPRGRRRPPLRAVDDVSLTVAPGETLGIVGESGSGKSTLGNAVLGLVPVGSGTIAFDGRDITRVGLRERRELSRDLQVIFQDPYNSLNPVRTIGQTLVEPLLVHGRAARSDMGAKIAAALARVGLSPDAADRLPAQFSGGQRQRIAIARALMVTPKLIICDEAVSALDLSVQAQVLNLLGDLQRELGLSYLFISHDLAVVRHVARRIAVMHRGRILELGTTEQILGAPRDPYTRRLIDAAPVPDPDAQRARRLARRQTARTDAVPDAPRDRAAVHR
jgi:ABC-type oligopeptide transport system ATPase subunit